MEATRVIDNDLRIIRLFHLANVMSWHINAHGRPVVLKQPDIGPPVIRQFTMNYWDTGTAACCLGSYALSNYGSGHFIMRQPEPLPNQASFTQSNGPGVTGYTVLPRYPVLACDWTLESIDAAMSHFGLPEKEACYLFDSGDYYRESTRPITPADCLGRIENLLHVYDRGTAHAPLSGTNH